MDYEKEYKEALERARECLKDGTITNVAIGYIEEIFPEVKESEDDRIRKWIINEIKIKHHNLDEDNVDFVDKAIAWLEKQNKQILANSAKTCKDEQKLSNVESIVEDLSKEYEVKINRIVGFIENLDIPDNDILRKDAAWLKSLKERLKGE